MRKLAFVATQGLPEYHNPVLSFQAGEVKDVPVDMADYLQDTFPENFTESGKDNENGLEGSPKEDDGQEPSEPELEEPAPTEVKQVAKSKRTNQRKRSTKLPKTKLFK